MREIIQAIKRLRRELGLRYDPDKLVQLYKLIDKLEVPDSHEGEEDE